MIFRKFAKVFGKYPRKYFTEALLVEDALLYRIASLMEQKEYFKSLGADALVGMCERDIESNRKVLNKLSHTATGRSQQELDEAIERNRGYVKTFVAKD